MSSRLGRALVRLYPKRMRDRYGDELIDLHDEIQAQHHLSRPRLIKDMLTGAILARPTRQILLAIGVVLAVCAAAAGGLILSNTGPGKPAARAVAQAPHTPSSARPPTATVPRDKRVHPHTYIPRRPAKTDIGNGVYYPPFVPPGTKPLHPLATQSHPKKKGH